MNLTIPEISYSRVGTGPAIVLIHGFPDSGAIWGTISDELRKAFTLFIPDLPGSGATPMPGDVTIKDMATGIKVILEKEGVNRVVLVGHSMGGYVALAFARLFPEMVAGLSLVHSTAAADDEEKKEARLKVIEIIRKGGRETFIRQLTQNLFSASYRSLHPAEVLLKEEAGLKVGSNSLIALYKAMIGRDDNVEMIGKATFPVQWIAGIDDNIINYKKTLRDCHQSNINFVTLYSNCGHISMVENPVKLTADLYEFGEYCFNLYRNIE
jgi:pimeloyl-ACP methyl ester carboxylesterase